MIPAFDISRLQRIWSFRPSLCAVLVSTIFLFGQMVAPSHSHAHDHDHAHHHEDEREAPTKRCEVCIVAVKDDAEFDSTPELEPVDGDAVRPQLYPLYGTVFGVSTSLELINPPAA